MSATPATQNACGCEIVPRLPREAPATQKLLYVKFVCVKLLYVKFVCVECVCVKLLYVKLLYVKFVCFCVCEVIVY